MSEDIKVTALKSVSPGDVVDTVRKLRAYLLDTQTLAFTLYADFSKVTPNAEREAVAARRTLELSVQRTHDLLTELEKSSYYQTAKSKARHDHE